MGLFSGVSKAVKKAVKRLPEETRNFSNSIVRTGSAVGAVPFQLVGQTAAQSISGGLVPAIGASGEALSATTGILRANPELLGLAGSAFGIPGMGGLFGGGTPAGGVDATGGMFTPAPASASIPTWLWIVGGLAAALGLFLVIRRKS